MGAAPLFNRRFGPNVIFSTELEDLAHPARFELTTSAFGGQAPAETADSQEGTLLRRTPGVVSNEAACGNDKSRPARNVSPMSALELLADGCQA